jgi:hypothetical protein
MELTLIAGAFASRLNYIIKFLAAGSVIDVRGFVMDDATMSNISLDKDGNKVLDSSLVCAASNDTDAPGFERLRVGMEESFAPEIPATRSSWLGDGSISSPSILDLGRLQKTGSSLDLLAKGLCALN